MADVAEAEAPKLPDLKDRVQKYEDWEEKTVESQKASRKARDYYDNKQWTAEDLATLKKRGQPPIVKNRIARKINFILGEEIRKRVDPAARPRTPQHEDAARSATDALRYAEDEEKFDAVRSEVLKNVLIEGFGGAIKEMKQDEDGDYKNGLRHVEWDRLFYDPASRAPDFSDALYLGIIVWLDLEDAVELYPDAKREIEEAVRKAGYDTTATTEDVPRGKSWADGKRRRVKIIEMYHRVGQDWYRFDFTKAADLSEPTRTFILDEKGRHSLCPLEMMSCYVDSDGSRYGIVAALISPQDEINKRSSKALHLLSVDRTTYEDGAIDDPVKYQSERAKPDGMMMVGPGGLSEGRIRNESGTELAQGQFNLLNEAKQDIDSIGPSASGINDLPGSISGRAFIARQQAAAQELGTVFDQLKQWTHSIFTLDWLCIRQYWTEEKWLRVTDDRELTGYRFVALNQRMTRAQRFQELLQKQVPPEKALETAAGDVAPQIVSDAQAQAAQMTQAATRQSQMMQQQGMAPAGSPPPTDLTSIILRHPMMAEKITVNQVDQMLIDIVIDEAPETAVLADEQFETLGQLTPAIVQAKPEMATALVRALLQASSLPNKRELLQEFDKGPDPAAQQAQQQQQAQLQQMAMALQQAQLQVEQTRSALQQAQAQNQQAQAEKTAVETQMLPAQTQAKMQADAVAAQMKNAQAQDQMQRSGVDTAIKMDQHQRSMQPHGVMVIEATPVHHQGAS
jgi:hypothetical protein